MAIGSFLKTPNMATKKKVSAKGKATSAVRAKSKSAAPAKKAAAKKSTKKVTKPAIVNKSVKPASAKKAAPKKPAAPLAKKVAEPKKNATDKPVSVGKAAPAPKAVNKGNAMPMKSAKHTDPVLEEQATGADNSTTTEKVPLKPKRFMEPRGAKPNELHRGQTAEHGNTHDRLGSQPERVRHLHPNGNRPNAGSARSTQYKGKRRDKEQ